MQLLHYDGTFAGFLSAVFDVYDNKFNDVVFTGRHSQEQHLFSDIFYSVYDEIKSNRVLTGLRQKISNNSLRQLYRAFLSEAREAEDVLMQYMRYVFSGKLMAEHDYSHPAVLRVQQLSKMVYREKHRMEAFVRFQLTADGLYFALVEPDFDVLPLIERHFRERYADQRWLIYDGRRKYGIYYDLNEVCYIDMKFEEGNADGRNISAIIGEKEELYQQLWQRYFASTNIEARKNMKLHVQHVPKRYWRFLTEKCQTPDVKRQTLSS